MPVWLVLCMCFAGGWLVTAISLKLMNILQLSSYRVKGLFSWLKRMGYDYLVRYFALAFFAFTSMFVFVMCFGKAEWYSELGFLFFVFICLYFILSVYKEPSKTPLKYTHRIKRLIFADFVLNFGLCFVSVWFVKDEIIMYSLMGLTPLFCIFTLIAAHYLMLPLEMLIGRSFEVKASKKLAAADPVIIGITGSYGKTTAKTILARFLMAKYKVYASPHSYNTPMGLSKCINEEYKGEEVFIAEMGARYSGDIKRITKYFKPRYAMITAIGNQHLETFKTAENIRKEKLSIMDETELAVVNSSINVSGDNIVSAGETGEFAFSDVSADIFGTKFTLKLGSESVNIETRLVGEHIPLEITLCAALAYKMGVSKEQIEEVAQKLPFVEHRLEVLNSGDMIILDDSYNSNPTGAESALNILDTYNGFKVVITPGFVELGVDSAKSLTELGENISKVADLVFLLGPNAETIKKGIADDKEVRIVASLDEAMEELREFEPPMAILFENDLPDNY